MHNHTFYKQAKIKKGDSMKKLLISSLLFLMLIPLSVDASSHGWGFKKNTNHQKPNVGIYEQMLEKYDAYYMDKSEDKVIYFTFDNGYEAGYTAPILDILKRHEVPAAFFLTGHYVKDQAPLVKRMLKEGHIIGNHSDKHPDFTNLTKQAYEKELKSLENLVKNVDEKAVMQYVRPPKGTFNEATLGWANELGYIPVFWSLAIVDWEEKKKGGTYVYDQIMKQIHPGAIILLHTVSKDNLDALEPVIKKLKAEGYQFKSLDDLVLKDILPKSVIGW